MISNEGFLGVNVFKLKKFPEIVFDTLLDMKKFLALKKEDTVFDYCERSGDVILAKRIDRGDGHFRTWYNVKRGIGVWNAL